MKRKEQKYFLYYRTSETSKNFVYAVKNCKIVETTKHYKKLKWMLDSNLIQACGYCTEDHYNDYLDGFINNLLPGNSLYIQNKINKLLTTK
jgi:hypothetical protein